jgi:predicted MFS family arabinose efflux permease
MLDIRPLRSAGFRHLAAAYWINEFGNWVGEIALAIVVYDRTRSALGTATLFLAMRFAPAVLAPFLTTRIEALPPRIALTILYAVEAMFFAALAVVTHHFTLALVLLLVGLDGTLAITAKALTRSVVASELVRSGLLREGNGILNLGAMISTAGAPILASLVVTWKGASTALDIDAATFLLAALMSASASGLQVESDDDGGFRGRLRAGLTVIRTHSSVRRLLLGIAVVMLVCSAPVPIDVVFAKHTLHAGNAGYGLMLASWGVAMIFGGVAFTRAEEVRLTTLLGACTLLIAAAYIGIALSPSLAVACAFSALGGAGNGAGWIAAVTAVQERIPLNTQAAVMSVLEAINWLMPAVGFAIGGAVTALYSPRVAYVVAGAGVMVVLVVFAFRRIDEGPFDGTGGQANRQGTSELPADLQEFEQTGRTRPTPDSIVSG